MGDAGLYRFRKGAELHANSPEIVRRMHAHVRAPDAEKYSALEELAERQGTVFLRDLLDTVPGAPVALDEVEPSEAVLKRFSTQAMSLGSLGPEAHRTLAVAMNLLAAAAIPGKAAKIRQLIATNPQPQIKSSKWRPDDLALPPIIWCTRKN